MKLDNPVDSDSTPEEIINAASEIGDAYYDADLQLFYMACDALYEKAKTGQLVFDDPDKIEEFRNGLKDYSRGVDEAGSALKDAAEYMNYVADKLSDQHSELLRKRDNADQNKSIRSRSRKDSQDVSNDLATIKEVSKFTQDNWNNIIDSLSALHEQVARIGMLSFDPTYRNLKDAAIKLGNLPDEEFDKAFVGNEGLW